MYYEFFRPFLILTMKSAEDGYICICSDKNLYLW